MAGCKIWRYTGKNAAEGYKSFSCRLHILVYLLLHSAFALSKYFKNINGKLTICLLFLENKEIYIIE